MRPLLPVMLVVACGAPPPPPEAPAPEEVSLDVVRAATSGGGTAVRARLVAPPDADLEVAVPATAGLTFGEAEVRREVIGGQAITTTTWPVSGSPGPYVVEGVCVPGVGDPPGPVCADPLYLTLGAAPERAEMADVVAPSRPWPAWVPWAVAGGVLALAGLVAWRTRGGRREEEVVVPDAPAEAPDVVALRRWEAVRHAAELDDDARAQALSELFRAYLEDCLAFPARSNTTTETLRHLEGLSQLPEGNLHRARRLLRATDLVKYAEKQPGSDFFVDLDSDLRAFVTDTRPATWGAS